MKNILIDKFKKNLVSKKKVYIFAARFKKRVLLKKFIDSIIRVKR